MSDLLERYIDGELSEAEAELFLAAVEEDPELAARLRTYESMLAGALAPTGDGLAVDFTGRVMSRVHDVAEGLPGIDRASAAPRRLRPVLRWVAVAAGLVIAFGLGALSPSLMNELLGSDTPMSDPVTWGSMDLVQGAIGPASTTAAEHGYRLVRLEYEPTSAEVRRVAVAGSFNDWDPDRAPMQRENGRYLVFLMLPAGSHEYQFVEDGERWVTDPRALQTRSDGFGSRNAVVDIGI